MISGVGYADMCSDIASRRLVLEDLVIGVEGPGICDVLVTLMVCSSGGGESRLRHHISSRDHGIVDILRHHELFVIL